METERAGLRARLRVRKRKLDSSRLKAPSPRFPITSAQAGSVELRVGARAFEMQKHAGKLCAARSRTNPVLCGKQTAPLPTSTAQGDVVDSLTRRGNHARCALAPSGFFARAAPRKFASAATRWEHGPADGAECTTFRTRGAGRFRGCGANVQTGVAAEGTWGRPCRPRKCPPRLHFFRLPRACHAPAAGPGPRHPPRRLPRPRCGTPLHPRNPPLGEVRRRGYQIRRSLQPSIRVQYKKEDRWFCYDKCKTDSNL